MTKSCEQYELSEGVIEMYRGIVADFERTVSYLKPYVDDTGHFRTLYDELRRKIDVMQAEIERYERERKDDVN